MNSASTFWILFGQYGVAMSLEQVRDCYFPGLTMKTMANKLSSGLLPKRTGDVFDTRDVAEWWDNQRKAAA